MKPAQAQLGEVAEVTIGITLRGASASRHDPEGTHHLVRISEVSEDGVLQLGEPNLLKLDESTAHRYTLRGGEVLLASRGSRLTATIWDGAIPAVAGGQFCVIRPQADTLLSGYLRWFLNLSSTQEELNSRARGTYMRSLPAKSLATLPVPIPPIPRQRAIAELHALRLQETALMIQLSTARATFVDHAIQKSLQR